MATAMSTTVLVVDDNEDNVQIMSAILLGRGFDVRIARDGKSALESIRQHVPRPDPPRRDDAGMDGMEVLDHVKADTRSARIPVIMVTAKSQDQDLSRATSTARDYYITKPFTSRQLLYAIELVSETRASA
jgi:CheY-like chemotaxis protein